MSRYDLDNLISQASAMDAPSRLPSKQPRWQRKNDSQLYNSFNVSNINQTNDILANLTIHDQHQRQPGHSGSQKTPGKTPNHKTSTSSNINRKGVTPSTKTPSRHDLPKASGKTPRTPIHGLDRYIPNRTQMDLEMSHYLMTQANKAGQENEQPNQDNLALREKLGSNLDQYRIMCYTDKAPVAAEGQSKNSMILYSNSKATNSAKKSTRYIPSQPEKILDAPDLQNDWYLSLVDWSRSNILAVALNADVYLWNAITGDIKLLFALESPEYISSLSWIQEGSHIAVGNSLNDIEIWDAESERKLRVMRGHSQRVNCLAWNAHMLTSGSKSGLIYHHDVRVPQHHVGTLNGHSGSEVCGLSWSPDGRLLASGANDNSVNIWSSSNITLDADNISPIHSLQHMSGVKALAWCPWRSHLLATGGGTGDRNIRVFNSTNGNCLYHVDTKSQVSGLEWSEEHQELISAHGYHSYELNIWKYPSLSKVTELRGHSARILDISISPDKSTVVSLGADETLRFWDCFQVDSQKKKKSQMSTSKTFINPIRMSLR